MLIGAGASVSLGGVSSTGTFKVKGSSCAELARLTGFIDEKDSKDKSEWITGFGASFFITEGLVVMCAAGHVRCG